MSAMAETDSQTARDEKHREVMGYERPLNAVWIALLIAATWIFWSFRAAAILFGLFVAATVVGIWVQRRKK
jgi:hypothetical protein